MSASTNSDYKNYWGTDKPEFDVIIDEGDGWLDSVGNWFSGLGDSILQGLEDVTSGIVDGIGSFFSFLLDGLLSGLEYLFVPSDNLGSDLKDKIYEKFPFIEQISSIVQGFLDIGEGAQEPDFSFTWYDTTVNIVDFSLVEDYLPIVHTIIVAIAWGTFFIRLYKSIPRLIGGFR